MNIDLLAVVTPLSIYHGFSTRKTFWEEMFTGEETSFSALNMKIFCRLNFRKHREIRGSEKYVTLDILVTTPDLPMFPNIATTAIFHVHSSEQIFLTCEHFLPESLPSGATIINMRWCYN